jgi:hypothetical protein
MWLPPAFSGHGFPTVQVGSKLVGLWFQLDQDANVDYSVGILLAGGRSAPFGQLGCRTSVKGSSLNINKKCVAVI